MPIINYLSRIKNVSHSTRFFASTQIVSEKKQAYTELLKKMRSEINNELKNSTTKKSIPITPESLVEMSKKVEQNRKHSIY